MWEVTTPASLASTPKEVRAMQSVNRATIVLRQRRKNVGAIHASDIAFIHKDDDAALATRTAIHAGRINGEIYRHLPTVSAFYRVNIGDVHCPAFTCRDFVERHRNIKTGFGQ